MDRVRGGVVGGVALGFALLLWVSAAGSVSPVRTPTTDFALPKASPPPVTPTPTPTATATTSTTTAPQGLGSFWEGFAAVFTVVVVVAMVVTLVILVVSLQRRLTRSRVDTPVRAVVEEPPDLPATLVHGAAQRAAALGEGSPRNGIVACWLSLEQAAAAAGVPRDPAETSAEFTSRVLATYTVDRTAIVTLSRLYREARFSSHVMDEKARESATAALSALHADLARRPAAASFALPDDS